MKINSIKTGKITIKKRNISEILDKYLPKLKEKSVLAITSKIISICDGRVVKIGEVSKEKLIEKEAEYFLPSQKNKYNIVLTIKNNILIPTAGIDESNGNGYYILWPEHPQENANNIRKYLKKKFSLKNLGVIITDSRTTFGHLGTTGVALAYSGFSALNNYKGKPDIFGRKLKVTQVNVADALAVAAVFVMGEGSEQTPLAVIEDIPFIKFKSRVSEREIKNFHVPIKDDIYAPLIKSAPWQKGKK